MRRALASDGDRRITGAEADSAAGARFARTDANADGRVVLTR